MHKAWPAIGILLVSLISLSAGTLDFRTENPINFYSSQELNGNNITGLETQVFENTGNEFIRVEGTGADPHLLKYRDRGLNISTPDNSTLLLREDSNIRVPNGNLGLEGNRVTNLGTPIDSGDAVRLQYVDDNFVNKSGDTLSGDLYFQDNNIVNPGEIQTGGNDDSITIRDVNNSQDIATFYEGGTVEIPNGGVDLNNNNLNNIDSINFDKGARVYDDQNFKFDSDSGYLDFRPSDEEHSLVIRQYDGNGKNFSAIRTNTQGTMQLRADGSNYQQLELYDSGEVEIGRGNLDLEGNNITSSVSRGVICAGNQC